jgi:ketosteroid isomerase-like protein
MTSSSIALAREFLAAWAAADVERFTGLLDENVSFDSPTASLQGRTAVAAAMADFAQVVTGVDNITAAADGDSVLVMYDMHTGPFGTIRAAEHYRVRDGRIVSDRLVFDTAPLQPPA